MEFIRRHFRLVSYIATFLVIGITVLSIFEIKKTRFDYEFESFFPVNDPDIDVYHDFRKDFGYDNEFVLLALENKKGIFREDFLDRVQTLADSLRTLPDVTNVQCPTDMTYISSVGPTPYIHLGEPDRFKTDSARIYHSEELVGSFFAKDGGAVSLYIKTTDGISKKKSDALVERMNKLLADGKFDKVHFASKLNGQKIYLDRLQKEFVIFFVASFLLIVLFLFVSFRSAWGVWVPILVVIISIIWTLALMTACGKPLDIMTVLLPTMMFVVGMSDVVHIVTKYLEELREAKGDISRFDALMKTIKDVGFATFITLITTAMGFITLLNSHIMPIRDFGLFTSIGVFISFILAFTIMPIVLNVIRVPSLKLERKSSYFWNKNLRALLSWIFRRRKAITIGTIALTIISFFFITKIKLNNYLIEGLTKHDQLREDFNYFENSFSGVRPFELVVTPSDSASSLLGTKELHAMDTLEKWLRQNYFVGFILSPATIVKEAYKSMNDGNPSYYVLPDDSTINDIVADTAAFIRRPEVKILLKRDLDKGRITGKMRDVGSLVIRGKNVELDSFMKQPFMKSIHVQRTGAAVMLDKNNEYLVSNMLQGLFFSILAVGLIIGVIHRSFKLAFIAIIPNLLPIIFIGGLMGYLGIDLKSSTSIIFSIAFGIATDDTVHFLGRLKLEMKKGKSVLYSLKRTYLSTGKAVVVTSLILSAGFFTLIFSEFESTFYFGVLVSITLMIAVMTDLLLFPLLVAWLVKKKKI
ncbi:MAG TPA: MMPL family transporter [Bacteroidia bacterium]|jgi:predicted RND superfamily exporter protein|nr:MMPL family transporter [Bacteroidia bacterium]